MSAVANPAIFKAYDIRGLYGSEIDGDIAELIGRAFVRVIGDLEGKPANELRLGLGHDMRLSAPELAARYREGMCREGATVLDAGEVATITQTLSSRTARQSVSPQVGSSATTTAR